MPEFRFINADTGDVLPNPTNLDSITIQFDFDGCVFELEEIPALTFCDADLLAELTPESGNFCKTINFLIQFRCIPSDPWQVLFIGELRGSDISNQCDGCEFTIQSRRRGAFGLLQENPNQSICLPATNKIDLFQVQSGAFYEDENGDRIKGDFVKLDLLIGELSEAMGGPPVVGGPLFADYLPDVHYITFPPVNAGDIIEIQIVGQWGQVINATIEVPPAGFTNEELETVIANTINYIDVPASGNINMDYWEFLQRVSCASNTAAGLEIFTDWEVTSINATINGAATPTITNPVPYQWGLDNVYVSVPGLFGSQKCITFEEIFDLLKCMTGAVVNGVDTLTDFYLYDDAFQTPTTPPITGVDATKTYNKQYMVGTGNFGWEFSITDFFGSINNWEWIGEKQVFTGPFGPNPVLTDGLYKFVGEVCIENTGTATTTYGVELLINGVAVSAGVGGILPEGGQACIPVSEFFDLFGLTNEFCFEGGIDTIEFSIITGTVAPFPPHTAAIEKVPCFDAPFLQEDLITGSNLGEFDQFEGCKGIFERLCSGRFYAGLGFGHSQQVQGLQDYSDTCFLIYRPDSSTTIPTRFKKCYYFTDLDADVCECFRGQTAEFYYYNVPLQLPYILSNWAQQIPSGIVMPVYTINSSFDGNGYQCNSSSVNQALPQSNDDLCILNFETCADPQNFVQRFLERTVNLVDVCGITKTAKIENMTYNLGTGKINYRVRV